MYKQIKEFKKAHNISKIAGLMMIHYFKWPWCLEALSDYVDEIYLLLHYTPEFKGDWPKKMPKVKDITEVEYNKEFTRIENRKIGLMGELREKTLRMLDIVKPDLVFFPDEDEAFGEPEYLIEDLIRFIESTKPQMAFKRCNFWDSMETVRKDRWAFYRPHVKIYKWHPQLTYLPYRGFNRVTNFGNKKMIAKTAIRHYGFMEKEERERKYHTLLKGQEEKYKHLLKKPKLVKYINALKSPRT